MVATMGALHNIASYNVAMMQRTRELNLRAGTTLFPEWTRGNLVAFLKGRLAGATSVAGIKDLDALKIPDFNQKELERVFILSPDELFIPELDATFPVKYVNQGLTHLVPIIEIDDTGDLHDYWQLLPDEGVKLPNGQAVRIAVNLGSSIGTVVGTSSMAQLKQDVKDRLNVRQFDAWRRPAVDLPDFGQEGMTVPEIMTGIYGECVVDKTPLYAYGVVHNFHSYFDRIEGFFTWVRNLQQAEQMRTTALRELERIRAEKRSVAEATRRQEELKTLRSKLDLYYKSYYENRDIPQEVWARLGAAYLAVGAYSYSYRTPTADDIASAHKSIAEIDGIVAAKKAKEAWRPEYLKQTRNFIPRAYLWVKLDGTMHLYCGKSSKGGNYTVDKAIGNPVRDVVNMKLGEEGIWQQVPTDTELFVKEVRVSGKQTSTLGEFKFTVATGKLPAGVWAASNDNTGKFFYPVIHYVVNSKEVVPDAVIIVR